MKYRFLIAMIAVILAVTILSGCSNDNNEVQRLVCEVSNVNAGAPLVSAYLNSGNDKIIGTDDDFLPIDWVPVLFKARPLNSHMVLPDNGTYSWFHITSYDLTWQLNVAGIDSAIYCYVDNPDSAMHAFDVKGGLIDAIVPVNDEAVVNVLVADRQIKEQPWFRALYTSLTNQDPEFNPDCKLLSFNAYLQFTFYGHESGNDHVVKVPAGLAVTFYGAVSSN